MIRSRLPLRLAGPAVRHPRVRRRPVALVFRRPPRTRPPAPPLAVRAGDRVSVTLAPRFTVLLQEFARAAAVVGRPDRRAPGRPGAPEPPADAGRLPVVHHRWSRGVPPPGRARDRVIVGTGVPRWSVRQVVVPPVGPAGRPPSSPRPVATGATRHGSPPRPAPPRLMVAARTGHGAPGRPGRADAGEVAGPRRRGVLDVADAPRRPVVGDIATRRPPAAPLRGGDHPATASSLARRVEPAPGGSTRPAPRPELRAAPVATVFRQARSTEPPPPAAPPVPVPAVAAPAAHPAVDIDQLDRELWRRFEKRARTERERRGRA